MNRIVIQFHTQREAIDFMNMLADMNYKPRDTVKVCGAGMCGQARIYTK